MVFEYNSGGDWCWWKMAAVVVNGIVGDAGANNGSCGSHC